MAGPPKKKRSIGHRIRYDKDGSYRWGKAKDFMKRPKRLGSSIIAHLMKPKEAIIAAEEGKFAMGDLNRIKIGAFIQRPEVLAAPLRRLRGMSSAEKTAFAKKWEGKTLATVDANAHKIMPGQYQVKFEDGNYAYYRKKPAATDFVKMNKALAHLAIPLSVHEDLDKEVSKHMGLGEGVRKANVKTIVGAGEALTLTALSGTAAYMAYEEIFAGGAGTETAAQPDESIVTLGAGGDSAISPSVDADLVLNPDWLTGGVATTTPATEPDAVITATPPFLSRFLSSTEGKLSLAGFVYGVGRFSGEVAGKIVATSEFKEGEVNALKTQGLQRYVSKDRYIDYLREVEGVTIAKGEEDRIFDQKMKQYNDAIRKTLDEGGHVHFKMSPRTGEIVLYLARKGMLKRLWEERGLK